MPAHDYRMPTKKERELKELLKEAQQLNAQLLAESSGALVIKELERENKDLRAEALGLKKNLKKQNTRMGNLTNKNKKFKELAHANKKEISALRMDVKVAHSLWKEQTRKLLRTEEQRYLWAESARKLGRELQGAKAEIRRLTARLNKSPLNSSLPPSADVNSKKVHNSRAKTGRSPGGQIGHNGHLRKLASPNEYVTITSPSACPECGGKLKVAEPTHRQVTELIITTKTTDYAASKCTCTCCGHNLAAPFPKEAQNEANYGNGVRAIASYLINRCNVSWENTIRFLAAASDNDIKLSKGAIQNFLTAFSKEATEDIGDITCALKKAAIIGSDATHMRSEGKRSYIYTYNTPNEVIFEASMRKGKAPLAASPLADYKGTIVHDHDSSYYNFGEHHAECNVHILRYLKGVAENEPTKNWSDAMRTLLCEANDAVKKAREAGRTALSTEDIEGIEARYDTIVACAEAEYAADEPIHPKYKPEGIALYTRLKSYRNSHLAFLYDLRIPFDNNASERLLRKAKGKLKQSGGFRSTENGQTHYCTYLSIVETSVLRGMEPFGVIRAIYNGEHGVFKEPQLSKAESDP